MYIWLFFHQSNTWTATVTENPGFWTRFTKYELATANFSLYLSGPNSRAKNSGEPNGLFLYYWRFLLSGITIFVSWWSAHSFHKRCFKVSKKSSHKSHFFSCVLEDFLRVIRRATKAVRRPNHRQVIKVHLRYSTLIRKRKDLGKKKERETNVRSTGNVTYRYRMAFRLSFRKQCRR